VFVPGSIGRDGSLSTHAASPEMRSYTKIVPLIFGSCP